MPKKMKSNILTTGEAAQMLGINARTFSQWVDKGLVKSWKVNKDRRVLREDLLKFAAEKNMPIFYSSDEDSQPEVNFISKNNPLTNQQEEIARLNSELNILSNKIKIMTAVVNCAEQCITGGKYLINEPYYKVEKEMRSKLLDHLQALKMYCSNERS